jgi:hypothetical protein
MLHVCCLKVFYYVYVRLTLKVGVEGGGEHSGTQKAGGGHGLATDRTAIDDVEGKRGGEKEKKKRIKKNIMVMRGLRKMEETSA